MDANNLKAHYIVSATSKRNGKASVAIWGFRNPGNGDRTVSKFQRTARNVVFFVIKVLSMTMALLFVVAILDQAVKVVRIPMLFRLKLTSEKGAVAQATSALRSSRDTLTNNLVHWSGYATAEEVGVPQSPEPSVSTQAVDNPSQPPRASNEAVMSTITVYIPQSTKSALGGAKAGATMRTGQELATLEMF